MITSRNHVYRGRLPSSVRPASEVAKMLGITKQAVMNTEQRALRKMRVRLIAMGVKL